MKSNVWMIDGLTMMEKYLLGYMVTSPHVNGIGYYHIPIKYMRCDTEMDYDATVEAMKGLIDKGFINYDQKHSMLAIANFNRYVTVVNEDIRNVNLSFLPPSGVFKTTHAWIATVYSTYDMENLNKKPWVQEALSMPVEDFHKKEIPMLSAPAVAITSEPIVKEGPVAESDATPKEDVPIEAEVVESVAVTETEPSKQEEVPAQETVSEEQPSESVSQEAPAVEENKEKEQVAENKVEEISEPASEEKASTPVAEKAPKKTKEVDPVTQQHIEEFEALWQKYPRKAGKPRALQGYLSMIKNGELTFAVASRALDNYLYQCKKDKTEPQYIINGNNFFGKTNKRILDYVEDVTENTTPEDADKKLREELAPKFKMFWCLYPKQVGKELAEKNFIELVKSGEFTAGQLQEAATAYRSECMAKNTEERYIKRADTFLDLTTRPFRDYLDRDDLNSFVNVHSGEVEQEVEEDGIAAMEKMLAETKTEGEKESVQEAPQNEAPAEKAPESEPATEEPAGEKDFSEAMTEAVDVENSFGTPSIPSYDDDDDDAFIADDVEDNFGDIGESFEGGEEAFPESDSESRELWEPNWNDFENDDDEGVF